MDERTSGGENLKRIMELTEKLSLGNLMPSPDPIVVSGDGRTFTLYGLMKEKAVAVLRTRMEPGMTVESHAHGEIEVIIVYGGSLVVGVGSKTKTLEVGGAITLYPNDLHRVYTTGGADLICITIPAAVEYPDGGK